MGARSGGAAFANVAAEESLTKSEPLGSIGANGLAMLDSSFAIRNPSALDRIDYSLTANLAQSPTFEVV